MTLEYVKELRVIFGAGFDLMDATAKEVLGIVYRHNHYCKLQPVSAKQASFALCYERGGQEGDIKQFDTFYRKIRNTFNKIEKSGFVKKVAGTRGYVLRDDFAETHMIRLHVHRCERGRPGNRDHAPHDRPDGLTSAAM